MPGLAGCNVVPVGTGVTAMFPEAWHEVLVYSSNDIGVRVLGLAC